MHEYPITQQIVKIAEEHAREQGASAVKKVCLVVGEQSGFVGDSIQMYVDVISKGTLCQGAEVDFRWIKAKLRCSDCGELFERTELYSFACPKCGGQGGPTDIGKEFYIDSIEIER